MGDWTDIVQVAAGNYHTVGLESDGPVVAVGLNDDGQWDVDGWMLKRALSHTSARPDTLTTFLLSLSL